MEENQTEEFIRVVIKCRSQNQREKDSKDPIVVDIRQQDNSIDLKYINNGVTDLKTFTFDTIFDETSTQKQIYRNIASPLIESLLEGQNGTIFTYGQTGCGKTYTLFGDNTREEGQGIANRASKELFNRIQEIQTQSEDLKENPYEFKVYGSFYRVYNEIITDLLAENKQQQGLKIKEKILGEQNQIYIQDLIKKRVLNEIELQEIIQQGKQQTGYLSNRDYIFFEIFVEKEFTQLGIKQVSSLKIVDFPGPERTQKTSLSVRQSENVRISFSLSTFGQIISTLVMDPTKHIPYRDSKVTRIMKDSLGGNSRAVMICHISPSQIQQDETLSTLRQANRAKLVRNKLRRNFFSNQEQL